MLSGNEATLCISYPCQMASSLVTYYRHKPEDMDSIFNWQQSAFVLATGRALICARTSTQKQQKIVVAVVAEDEVH